ncbi:MAG: response regulator [Anaerolineales bacterium]|nr:response regulator [Anaerolineales bacterium]
MDDLPILVSVNYWLLIHIWVLIIFIWLYRIRTTSGERRLLLVFLAILVVEAFRTIFENLYFGAWHLSLAELIPVPIQAFLVRPTLVLAPQIINIVSGLTILGILVLKWSPGKTEGKEKRAGFIFKVQRFLEGKDIVYADQESEDLFLKLMQSGQIGVFDWTCESESILTNEAFNKIFNFPPERASIHRDEISDRLYPEDRERVWLESTNYFRSDSFSSEYRLSMPDGTIRWASSIASMIPNETGIPKRIVGIVTDITAQKNCEIVLREKSKRLEELVNQRSGELEAINFKLDTQITERKSIEADLLNRQQYQAALSHSTQAINASLNVNEVLEEIKSFVSNVAPSDGICLILVDEQGRIIERCKLVGDKDVSIHDWEDGKDGVLSWVVYNKEPVIVDEVEDKEISSPEQAREIPYLANRFVKQNGFKSFAVFPLLSNDKLLGLLNLSSQNPYTYSDRAHLLAIFSNQAALAIEKARLLNDNQNRAANTESLVRMANLLNAQLDIDSVLNVICEETARAMNVMAAGVSLFDPETGRFVHAAIYGLPSYLEQRIETIQDLSYDDLINKQELLINAHTSDSGLNDARLSNEGKVFYTIGRAAMIREGLVIGSINLYDIQKNHSLTTQENELLLGLADQAAQAIVNARLIEKTIEQAEQVNLIIDTVPEGVLLLGSNLEIQMANPVARKYLAVLSGARVGKKLERLGLYPIEELLTSPVEQGLWHRVEAANCVFNIIARPVDYGSKTPSWVLVIRDVTLELESQKRIHQQERLAAVGQLAAGIAHDFNNLMSVIVLYGQLMLKEGGILPKTRDRLGTIIRQAKQATDLIGQILEFSRSSNLERKPLKLAPVLKEQVKLLERTLPENIKIQLSTITDEIEINGDPTRLQQMIMNLVVNARDAMLEGGVLNISISKVPVEKMINCVITGPVQTSSPDWIRLDVSDTGTGIEAGNLTRIFEPFFTTKEQGKGCGLGLAQVYAIVQQHEGHLAVESELNKGTTFSIFFPPVGNLPAPLVDESQGRLTMGHGETILIVEDNPLTREAVRDGLDVLNYSVIEAQNGREALTILNCQSESIDLILSDLVMPEMGGKALTRALEDLGITIPLVILSGHPLNEKMEELESIGVAAWLEKPPDLERLASVVAGVLSER